MTKTELKNIMARAHEIARQCEGDYAARLALGLRRAWFEARLRRLGNEWQKAGHHRIYFNDLATLYGLELDHFKSGNIAYAEFRGQRVSNSEARRIQGRLAGARVWYDMHDGRFHAKGLALETLQELADRIKAAAKAA